MYDVILKRKQGDRKDVHAFDIIVQFEKDSAPEIFIDEDTYAVLDMLLTEHGKVSMKMNWFDEELVITVPNKDDQKDDLTNTDTHDSIVKQRKKPARKQVSK